MSEHDTGSEGWRLDWPVSGGRRLASARLKVEPEDFLVEELLEPDRDQGGEHLYLRLEKRGDNTDYLARQLAGIAGCRHFDVGFCGLKDRHAVTRQWFSLYRPGAESEDRTLMEEVAERWPVLDTCRGSRKLRRGDHSGNHFRIRLREVLGSRADIDRALASLKELGCPNYFGPQRFGHGGANLDHAVRLDPATLNRGGGRKRGRGRRGQAGTGASKDVLYFSAARSWLFNEVLARRVEEGSWNQVLDGEPGVTPEGEPCPTGPLWGDGGTTAESHQGALERRVVDARPELAALFSATRMKPERRRLVLMPEELSWRWESENLLELAFSLAPGQYATVLLGELFELEGPSPGG